MSLHFKGELFLLRIFPKVNQFFSGETEGGVQIAELNFHLLQKLS